MIQQDVFMSAQQAQIGGELLTGLWPLVVVLISGLSVMVAAYSKVLSNRLTTQSERIDILQKRNDDLEAELGQARNDANVQRRKVLDKEGERIQAENEAKQRYDDLKEDFEGKLDAALSRIGTLESNLKVTEAAKKNLENQLTMALQEGDRQRDQNMEMTQRFDTTLEAARKQTDEIKTLTSTNEGLRAERDALVQKAADRDERIQLLTDCNERMTVSVDNLKTRVDDLTRERPPELTKVSPVEGE